MAENKSKTHLDLPNLLYISDVPVELTFAGPTLIYRLLEFYPKDKLLIIQGTGINSLKRIPNVRYISRVNKVLERMASTRFHKIAKIYQLLLTILPLSRKISRIIKDFNPDCVLSITFNTAWIDATSVAKKNGIPLYLILHDELLLTENYSFLNKYFYNQFKLAYRYADSRLCISEQMEKLYFSEFGVSGTVLLPCRGKNDTVFTLNKDKFLPKQKLNFCYAGTLFTGDFLMLLDKLSFFINLNDGNLYIYTNNVGTLDEKRYPNLCHSNIIWNEMIDPESLKKFMIETIDINIILNSFEFEDVFRYNFSSKLVDYSSTLIPVLFFGPKSSGVISWAVSKYYPLIISDLDDNLIIENFEMLNEPFFREKCANIIKEVFNASLSYEVNSEIFYNSILANRSLSPRDTNSHI